MDKKDLKICIIGGGIAGLTTAIALAQRGASVRVFEQAPEIKEVGAGLQISPNGLCVLSALGLGSAISQMSVRAQAVSLCDYAHGREVTRLDLSKLAEGEDYRFIHRADLISLLLGAAKQAGVDVTVDAHAASTGAEQGLVTLASGEEIAAALVVGAEGLHSKTRMDLNGDQTPFFTGQVAWRAVVKNTIAHPAHARVTMGKGKHLVSYPLRDGQYVNLVAVEERADWAPDGWTHMDSRENLLAAFAEFGGDAAQLLSNLPEQVGLWGLFRHPVATHWSKGKAVLVGDAAHPTLPFLSQGANMAMEDGWALAACLDRHDTMDDAFQAYQSLRIDRVRKVIAKSNDNARKYHLRNPMLRGVAHLGLSAIGKMAPDLLRGGFDWLYRYDITKQV